MSVPDSSAVDAVDHFVVFAVMNVNGFEAMMILLVALIVLGPDRLPEAARKAGNFINQMKRMSDSFQQEIRDAVDLPDLDVPDLDTLMKPKSAIMKSVMTPPTVVARTKAAEGATESADESASAENATDDSAATDDSVSAEDSVSTDDPTEASDPFANAERSSTASGVVPKRAETPVDADEAGIGEAASSPVTDDDPVAPDLADPDVRDPADAVAGPALPDETA